MIKYLSTFLLVAVTSISSQTRDSLFNSSDSLLKDSTGVIVNTDSLVTYDSLGAEKMKPDTLAPIQSKPLNESSEIIDKNTYLFYNYRYAGDFLRSFSFNFIEDYAFIGYPNESFIYGAGNNGISFLEDGVLWNNRYSNSLNLNNIQSEDIDSIEVIRSPRGFLFGPYNNSVSANFIMKDFLSPIPYTRIKYYEGPNGEAMIDGKFNAQIYKRWNLSFEVTNRGADSSYKNSEYSLWQANVKLKYFLSNSVNLTALYSYVKSKVGLNGGVDIDSIKKTTTDINSILYSPELAPVISPYRKENLSNHNFGLRLQAIPYRDANIELSLYYKYNLNETRDYIESLTKKYKYEVKTYGTNLNYVQNLGMFSARILGNWEKNKFNTSFESLDLTVNSFDYNYFSAAGILSLHLLDSTFVPSVFYKYFNQGYRYFGEDINSGNSGYGLDFLYKPLDEISLYTGYSIYGQDNHDDQKNFELGVKAETKNLLINVKYFDRENFYPYSLHNIPVPGQHRELPYKSIAGFGINLNYHFWKLLIETNTSHYFNKKDHISTVPPDVQFTGGIYLNNMFFEDNLYFKGGFIFYYTGKFKPDISIDVDPSNKLDFSLTGEIKKVAIVYFTWENLFNNQYYITPYYPMPERSIRFGVAWELFN
jgi:hypothetical protein